MPFDIGGFVYNTAFIQDYAKGGIVTDGLILHLDAAYGNSYPKGGTTWYDLSGNGYNHGIYNGASYNSQYGGYINIDPTDDYIANLGTSPTLSSSHTLIAWARMLPDSSVSTWRTLWRTQPADHPLLVQDGTGIIGYYDNNSAGFVSYGLNAGTLGLENIWIMYTIVSNGSSTTLHINDSVITGTVNYTASGNYFHALGSAAGSQTFGPVAHALVYNRALSNAEIKQNYDATKNRFSSLYTVPDISSSNLLMHLDAGNSSSYPGSGTVWYDLQNSYNVSLINGPAYNSSNGGYITFDGSNDYGNLSSEPNLGRVFTINTVLRLFNSVSVEIIYAPTSADRDHWFEIRGNKVSIQFVPYADGPSFRVTGTTTMSTNRTQFYMLTAVASNNTARVYLNGIQENSGTAGFTFATWNNANGWIPAIARRANLSQYYLGADIANIRMYNRVLSNEEIRQLHAYYKDRYNLL